MAFHFRGLVVVASTLVVLAGSCGAAGEGDPAREARLRATVPVGEDATIAGIAVGEGGVWVAGLEARAGAFIWRIDPERNEVVARIRVGSAHGVAAGDGAVWVAGGTCVEPLPEDPDVCRLDPWVSRLDPGTNKLVTRIPLDPPRGVRRADSFPWRHRWSSARGQCGSRSVGIPGRARSFGSIRRPTRSWRASTRVAIPASSRLAPARCGS